MYFKISMSSLRKLLQRQYTLNILELSHWKFATIVSKTQYGLYKSFTSMNNNKRYAN